LAADGSLTRSISRRALDHYFQRRDDD